MKAMKRLTYLLLAMLMVCSTTAANGNEQPNILWIIVDDMSAHFSSYGEELIETPHVDALAKRGVQFNNAYVTAPVCSTCRSAFITGMYQTTIGAHHHRSGRGTEKIHLPEGIRPIPEMFQEEGYYTTITGWPIRADERLGKTDYNFEWNASMYNGADWAKRKDGQPFFAQIQLPGGKLRGGNVESTERFVNRIEKTFGNRTDVNKVSLPPYYPATDIILQDWAAYLDSVRETDRVVGEILTKLREEGDLENTIVLFMTDHGISHVRGKQFMYDEGLHVPLVIAGPGIEPEQIREDLVEHIDIAALSLAYAQITIPDYMQAQDIMAADYHDLLDGHKLASEGNTFTERNLKLGLEVGWNRIFNGHHVFAFRLGRNGPYNSQGMTLNVFGVKMDFAKYSQEVGGYAGEQEDKRWSFQLGLVF